MFKLRAGFPGLQIFSVKPYVDIHGVLGTTLDGHESLREALRLISLLMDVYVEGANDTMVDLAASLIDERIVEWTKGLRGQRHWFSR